LELGANSSHFEKMFFVLGNASFRSVGVVSSVRAVSLSLLTRLVKANCNYAPAAIFLVIFQWGIVLF